MDALEPLVSDVVSDQGRLNKLLNKKPRYSLFTSVFTACLFTDAQGPRGAASH